MEWTEQDRERLRQQFDFIIEIDKEKEILRQTPLADGSRRENDAEHSWHMAVMVLLLAEYATEPIDPLRTIAMLLVHDLVEIYSGDTYAYDEAGKATQRGRELEAADRLFSRLPPDQAEYMRGLWDEFEARETPEARFARTMDNLQPMMLNHASDGISWVEHGVKLSQILKRNERTAEGSGVLWDYAREEWLMPNVRAGHILDDSDLVQ